MWISCVTFFDYTQPINQSNKQSNNVFQGKIQTVQFTIIYKHSIFTWYTYDNHDNEN